MVIPDPDPTVAHASHRRAAYPSHVEVVLYVEG
eukprot:gene26703-biopygen17190